MLSYFDDILSKYQCRFRKGFNAQHCLVSMIEKWKESVDIGGAFGTLMTDSLMLLTVYIMVKLIQQYISNRKQRLKAGNAYSSWKEIFYKIP